MDKVISGSGIMDYFYFLLYNTLFLVSSPIRTFVIRKNEVVPIPQLMLLMLPLSQHKCTFL